MVVIGHIRQESRIAACQVGRQPMQDSSKYPGDVLPSRAVRNVKHIPVALEKDRPGTDVLRVKLNPVGMACKEELRSILPLSFERLKELNPRPDE